jgi:hypothetical protein
MAVVPALRKLRQEDQEFKAILSYIASAGPAWATQHPFSKPNKHTKILKNINSRPRLVIEHTPLSQYLGGRCRWITASSRPAT